MPTHPQSEPTIDWPTRFDALVAHLRLLIGQMERQMQQGSPCGACHAQWFVNQGQGHFKACQFAKMRDWVREADNT
jgi:hypothetical protein